VTKDEVQRCIWTFYEVVIKYYKEIKEYP